MDVRESKKYSDETYKVYTLLADLFQADPLAFRHFLLSLVLTRNSSVANFESKLRDKTNEKLQ